MQHQSIQASYSYSRACEGINRSDDALSIKDVAFNIQHYTLHIAQCTLHITFHCKAFKLKMVYCDVQTKMYMHSTCVQLERILFRRR